MTLSTVLFIDLDGVIRHWTGDDSIIEEAHGLPPGALKRVAFAPERLTPAITGAVSDERWRATVVRELRRRHPQANAEGAVAACSSSPGQVDGDVLSLLDRCTRGLRVVLATNATSRLDADLRSLGIHGRFHAVANSSALRVVKPHAEFFAAALRSVQVTAADALFVDDTPVNVTTAARLGITSHLYAGEAGLRLFLEDAGVVDGGNQVLRSGNAGNPSAIHDHATRDRVQD